MIPPIGRDINPTKNVVYASNVPTNGSKFGKNSLLSTIGVTTPNRKKSYHSIVVPMALANAIVPIDVPNPPDCVFVCIGPPWFRGLGSNPLVVAESVALLQHLPHVAHISRIS